MKDNKQAYEIMLLRSQYENTFADIAKEYRISVSWAVQIYNRQKNKQIQLYIKHIAATLGHESTLQIRNVFCAAFECYQNQTYACAYLKKIYSDILAEYRQGEPGMPPLFIKNMPPYKSRLGQKTIARVVEMREAKKASFAVIAKELRLTCAKAKHTYEWFYHKQALALIEALQDKAQTNASDMGVLF